MNRTMSAFEWALLILLSVIWGGAFFFAEVALEELPPMTVVFARVGLAAPVLILIVFLSRPLPPITLGLLLAFVVMGLLNNVMPFSLIVWGQTALTGGVASILNATTPLFTALLAAGLTRDEPLTPPRVLGVLLGFAGVAVMIGPSALRFDGAGLWAQLAVLGAAVSYAFASIFGRWAFAGLPFALIAAGQVTASTLMMAPLALVIDDSFALPNPSLGIWAALVSLAVLSTAGAYLIYFRLLRTVGATNLMLVTLLIPVSALLLGIAFLGEVMTWRQGLGMTGIALGLLAIDGRVFALFKAAR